jgi:hypothetical protein
MSNQKIPLWYLLVTPVVSSDYPCGIFWLPMWYLLVTSVVSSDHPCGLCSEDTTEVTRRYHMSNQKIPQGKSEDITG